jgi:hypothetical protein
LISRSAKEFGIERKIMKPHIGHIGCNVQKDRIDFGIFIVLKVVIEKS